MVFFSSTWRAPIRIGMCPPVLIIFCLLLPFAPAVSAVEYRGMTVEAAIEQFELDGLTILYSSDVVKPWMRVRDEPAGTDARALLEQMLAPYGLIVRDGPAASLLIVRGEPPTPASGRIAVRVVDAATGAGVAGLAVGLNDDAPRVLTDADGQAQFDAVSEGRHQLVIRSDGEMIERIAVDVVRGRTTNFVLPLAGVRGPDLAELVVTASQYELARGVGPMPVSMSAADLEFIPNPGDDPMRAVARLPGVASADYTAKSNIRGGEVDEMLVRFDNLRLYNPFHLKDFKSVFSAIDPGITQQMDIYTGGFPSTYGDRMSSVIDIASLPASEIPYREVSLSFFNASGLAKDSFNAGRGDWLVSARRGNLDLFFDVIDSKLGDPTYLDVYTRVANWFTDEFGVSANFLLFDDDIVLFDSDQEESAQADYRDVYYWLRFDLIPTDQISGNVIWARTELDSRRSGVTDQPGAVVGSLSDVRSFSIDSLQTDWSWRALERLELRFGAQVSLADGHYRYQDQADFALLFLTPGATRDASRRVQYRADVDGEYIGAYVNARWQATTALVAEAGLRWDRETVSAGDPAEISPRFALLYALGDATDLRASWGRYYQAQAINELQLSDGITTFAAPQRSDHIVLGFDHRLRDGIEFRLELYQKEYDDLRVRYENFLNPLVLLPELKPDRVRIAPDGSRAKGVEATLRQPGNGPWSWWLSYAWASVKDRFRETDVRRSWDQTHNLGFGLGWRSARWELSAAGNYRTGWPTTAVALATAEPFPLVATGRRNAQRLGNYASLDVRIARHWSFSETHSLSLFLEISNLFNRDNDCCTEYEVDDETGELLLEIEAVNGLPFIPSAGFVWRF